jgi:hypothetical protein
MKQAIIILLILCSCKEKKNDWKRYWGTSSDSLAKVDNGYDTAQFDEYENFYPHTFDYSKRDSSRYYLERIYLCGSMRDVELHGFFVGGGSDEGIRKYNDSILYYSAKLAANISELSGIFIDGSDGSPLKIHSDSPFAKRWGYYDDFKMVPVKAK